MEYEIQLMDLKFFARHGVYEEERVLGGWFTVDVTLTVKSTERVECITDTVNYAAVYEQIRVVMMQPELLLETVADKMLRVVLQSDPRILQMQVKINKNVPPISKMMGNIAVCLQRSNHTSYS
jgi:dihydroneopterin aldolase